MTMVCHKPYYDILAKVLITIFFLTALSSRMIDRIFSGAVTRGRRGVKKGEERMSYTEFVWFLLSEEDKTHPTAIEYWFRLV